MQRVAAFRRSPISGTVRALGGCTADDGGLQELLMIRFALIVTTAVTLGAAPLVAQSFQGRDRSADRIPPGLMPPPGMCRIWLDGVPAGQQPAPTDCASAVRNRPGNARVIFGDDYTGQPQASHVRGAAGDPYGERRLAMADDEDDPGDDLDDEYDEDARRGATTPRRDARSASGRPDEFAVQPPRATPRDPARDRDRAVEEAYERGYQDAQDGRDGHASLDARRFDDYQIAVPPGSDPRYFSSAPPPGCSAAAARAPRCSGSAPPRSACARPTCAAPACRRARCGSTRPTASS